MNVAHVAMLKPDGLAGSRAISWEGAIDGQ
jgi:hypothetical protein